MTKAKVKTKAKNRVRKKASLGSNPLPPPLPVGTETPQEPLAQNNEHKGGGLLGFFEQNPVTEAEPLLPSSEDGSIGFSTSSFDAEAARLLEGVPDVIGEDGEGQKAGDVGDAAQVAASAPPSNVIPFPAGPVSAKMLSSLIEKSFSWVADWRKRECYRIGKDDAQNLTDCTLPVLNPWVARLMERLLGEWAQTNPELIALVWGWSTVVGPMIAADMAQTALEAAKKKTALRTPTSHVSDSPTPAAAPSRGVWFHDQGEEAA